MTGAPIRCPSCSASETIWVKPAWQWSVRVTGWLWWRRLRAVREQVGDCVVCLKCDTPYVVTASGSFAKRRTPVAPTPNRANASRDLDVLHAAVNALPDEPA